MLDVVSYDHIGIRVSDFKKALKFYQKLGFELVIDHQDDRAYEIVNKYGIRLNLIVNAEKQKGAHNVLLDEEVQYPGYTHVAFILPDLKKAVRWVKKQGLKITEGPKEVDRRIYFFIRDPDGNVLEFNELK